MAGYSCNYHDGQGQATLLLTDLTSGQTLATCADDAPVMLTGALAAFLNVDTGKLWQAIERFAKRNQQAPPEPPAQDQAPEQDQVTITCPFCQTDMTVLATDADLAKESHLASCAEYAKAQESESQ